MTTDTEKIADVIVAAVRVATAPIVAKCEALASTVAVLETRAAVPGPPGEPGPKGEPGPAGPPGQDAPIGDELDADAITAAFTELLRKELDTPALRRRTVRDATGAVKYEIEET